MNKLQEKILTLGTAVRLSTYSTGAPGPPGLPGSPGPRGFAGDDLSTTSEAYSSDRTRDNTYSVLDSFIQTEAGYCKCQRGPIVRTLNGF